MLGHLTGIEQLSVYCRVLDGFDETIDVQFVFEEVKS